jgi:hypothetical protein
MKTCRNCGGTEQVRRGLCERCRAEPASPRHPSAERDPALEPLHDRPWVARSAFTRRTRRSPRT